MGGVVVVGVAGVVVGVGCEGFEVEFAGGGEDAGCDFASESECCVSLVGFRIARVLKFVSLRESSG